MPKAAELARRALEIRERALNDKVITPDNDDLLSSYYQMASMCVQNSEHAHAAHYYELVLDGLRKSSLQTETVLREIQRVTRDNTIFVVLIRLVHNKFFPNNKNLLVKFQMERKREI